MAGRAKGPNRKYAYLEQLSTEKLMELLLLAPSDPADEEDSEYYDAIEEVILEREREQPSGLLSDVNDAWKEFQEHYMDPEGDEMRLYPDEDEFLGPTSVSGSSAPSRKRSGPILKRVVVAAFAAALLISVAQANGWDIIGNIARWTAETLHFGVTEDASQSKPDPYGAYYEALQSAVEDIGITEAVVPTWYPDGYTMGEIEYSATDLEKAVYCPYSNIDGTFFSIEITKYDEESYIGSLTLEKDNDSVKQYICNGKKFYIMSNLKTMTATWASGDLYLNIIGTLTTENLELMLDSIGG